MLRTRPYTIVYGYGPNEALHEKFACKREHDDVEGHKGKVTAAFAIMSRRGRIKANGLWNQMVGPRERVGEKDSAV